MGEYDTDTSESFIEAVTAITFEYTLPQDMDSPEIQEALSKAGQYKGTLIIGPKPVATSEYGDEKP